MPGQTHETRTVEGIVTFARGGDKFAFIRLDDGRAVRLGLKDGNRVFPGTRISATGLVTQTATTCRMEFVTVRELAKVPEPEAAAATLAELQLPPGHGRRDWFGVVVSVVARVEDVNRRRTQVQLLLADADGTSRTVASFALREGAAMDPYLRRGAIIRARGVPSMDYALAEDGSFAAVEDLTLNIAGPWMVEVLNRPPWWTPGRVAAAASAAALAIVLLAVWVVFLLRARRAERRALAEADAARRERLRLSADLHDNFQQLLAGAMFHIKAAQNYASADPAKAANHLRGAEDSLAHTQSGLRAVLWGLAEESEGPVALSRLLEYAIARMPHWQGIVEFSATGREGVETRKFGGALLMIMQEAVANAINHGAAATVRVKLRFAPDGFAMMVADDGSGFDPARPLGSGHLGLADMKTRAAQMGGSLRILSRPRKGTAVIVKVATRV